MGEVSLGWIKLRWFYWCLNWVWLEAVELKRGLVSSWKPTMQNKLRLVDFGASLFLSKNKILWQALHAPNPKPPDLNWQGLHLNTIKMQVSPTWTKQEVSLDWFQVDLLQILPTSCSPILQMLIHYQVRSM